MTNTEQMSGSTGVSRLRVCRVAHWRRGQTNLFATRYRLRRADAYPPRLATMPSIRTVVIRSVLSAGRLRHRTSRRVNREGLPEKRAMTNEDVNDEVDVTKDQNKWRRIRAREEPHPAIASFWKLTVTAHQWDGL